MPVKANFQGRLNLNFFPNRKFESTDGLKSSQQAPIIARNVARFLMMGWTSLWTQFLTWNVFDAIFIKRDHTLLKELRFAFQQGFFEIFEQIKNKELTAEQKEQVHLYLSNCMTFLPYGDLTPYESIKIPQFIDGKWEMVEYQITQIELTKALGWRRLFIKDKDRVFAYGLKPFFQKKAESHLIFMGTTYPAGQGFIPQINTDFKGFETVGESLYRTGRPAIQEWLSQQENSIHVCGISLGATLSLLLALDKGNYKLSRVDALNPAGLHDAWSKSEYDFWDSLIHKPHIVVQKQGNDPVSAFGIWKKNWDILHVIPPQDKRGPISFCDHFLNYAGFSGTQFHYIDAKQDNVERRARNFWFYSLGRSSIYYFFLIPYTYMARPLIYLMTQNWMLLVEELFVKKKFAKLHDPSLPRNPTMDIYNKDNAVDIALTYRQIHTYYKVMRCLLKNKDYLSNQESESKHVNGMSKTVLLKKSLELQDSGIEVSFKATKAKIASIEHTLSLVKQIGLENQERLKNALDEHYQTYRLGKR